MKVLCLHGYHGSAHDMREDVKGLSPTLSKEANLVFVDAPALAAGDFGWWHATAKDQQKAAENPGVSGDNLEYRGWERSRAALVNIFATQGPFDGILGFSQGAAMTALAVGLRTPTGETPSDERPLQFSFAIMTGGFSAVDAALIPFYERHDSYALPSLHMMGRTDFIVPMATSKLLAAHFANPVIVEHDGGHIVPSTPAVKKQLAAFLAEQHRLVRVAAKHSSTRASQQVSLWPGKAARAMRVIWPAVTTPTPRPAMVVLRGGAYSTSQGSGDGAAEWLASQGLVAIEVDYGTQETKMSYPQNYADAARAMRLVRSNAAAWGVDPNRVGLLGFSAGGHLASLVSTQPELFKSPEDDLVATISARPDLVVLAYPLLSFIEGYAPYAYAGSVENFFGHPNVTEEERRAVSAELHVTAQHPPVFVWTTAEDTIVPPSQDKLFVQACERAGVPVHVELYPHGQHGLGLALKENLRSAALDPNPARLARAPVALNGQVNRTRGYIQISLRDVRTSPFS